MPLRNVVRPASAILRPKSMQSHRMLTSGRPLFIKENANRSPQQLETTKQEQLNKQKRGEGQWHEELASQGESNIAADRQQVDDHNDHMKTLQEETKKKGDKGEL